MSDGQPGLSIWTLLLLLHRSSLPSVAATCVTYRQHMDIYDRHTATHKHTHPLTDILCMLTRLFTPERRQQHLKHPAVGMKLHHLRWPGAGLERGWGRRAEMMGLTACRLHQPERGYKEALFKAKMIKASQGSSFRSYASKLH